MSRKDHIDDLYKTIESYNIPESWILMNILKYVDGHTIRTFTENIFTELDIDEMTDYSGAYSSAYAFFDQHPILKIKTNWTDVCDGDVQDILQALPSQYMVMYVADWAIDLRIDLIKLIGLSTPIEESQDIIVVNEELYGDKIIELILTFHGMEPKK